MVSAAALGSAALGSAALEVGPLPALQALLRAHGCDVTRQQLAEVVGERPGPDEMVDELSARGVEARAVRVGPDDLDWLALPALVMLGEEATVLRAVGRRSAALETSAGTVRVPRAELDQLLSGVAIETLARFPAAGGIMRRLWSMLRQQPRLFVGLLAASALMQALGLLVPAGLGVAIDRALPNGASSLLNLIALGLLATAVFHAAFGWLREYALRYLNASLIAHTGRGTLQHLLELPFLMQSRESVGRFVQIMAGSEALMQTITDVVLTPVLDGALALWALVLLALILPWPAAVFAVIGAMLLAFSLWTGHRQSQVQRRELQAQADQNEYLYSALTGMATIKAFGAEQPILETWLERLHRERSLTLRRERLGLYVEVAAEGARRVLYVSVLMWGGYHCLEGALSVGLLMTGVQLAYMFLDALVKLSGVCVRGWAAAAHVAELDRLLLIEAQGRRARLRSRAAALPIVISNVWFRYSPEAPWVLQQYDLKVKAGEHRLLNGRSGIGKTTILRLVAGLCRPEQGEVMVGNVSADGVRNMVAYLPQHGQLLQGSILDNLRVFSGGAPRERLLRAARLTGLDRIVSALPMGYETLLPAGGTSLSGGQRQLVMLSGVAASDRPVILLDEALSHVDPIQRAGLLESELFQGRTLLYVSHEAASHGASDEAHDADPAT